MKRKNTLLLENGEKHKKEKNIIITNQRFQHFTTEWKMLFYLLHFFVCKYEINEIKVAEENLRNVSVKPMNNVLLNARENFDSEKNA